MREGAKALLIHVGAFGFGVLIGWFVYYVNRYRKGDVQFSDITTLIGIIGGGAVTALFGTNGSTMFGAYGIGLAVGFFTYFNMLLILVSRSNNFDWDWFLDGRRKGPEPPFSYPGDMVRPPMDEPSGQ
jgi:hypothetical protein